MNYFFLSVYIDPNPWYEDYNSTRTLVIAILYLVVDSILLGFALLKLFTLIKEQGFQISISIVTLILAAMTSVCIIVVDIVVIVQSQIQPFTIFVWAQLWLFIPDTIQIMAALTISFYW